MSEGVLPTERGLIARSNSPTCEDPKRVIATDMPAFRNEETQQDSQEQENSEETEQQVEIKFPHDGDNNEDLLQIEDQDAHLNLSKKSKPHGKVNDVSSIIDRFDSVDHADKTLQQMNGLFDDKQSKATPAMSRLGKRESGVQSEMRLEEEDLDACRNQIVDHLNQEKTTHKRIQSAVTTVGLVSSEAADEAIEIPSKAAQKKKKGKQEKKRGKQEKKKDQQVTQNLQDQSSAATSTAGAVKSEKPKETIPVIQPETQAVRKTDAVEDMIQDLYSEDNLEGLEDYNSPTTKKEPLLNPVIEESHEYSVTPSRVVQSSNAISNVVTPIRENQNKQQVVPKTQHKVTTNRSMSIEQLNANVVSPQRPVQMDSRRMSENLNKFAPRTFNTNEFNMTTASFLGRTSHNSVVSNQEKKLQGAQIYRSKRDLINRNNSVDDNQFIKKGQEMVHESFGETDLSKSFISAKKDPRLSIAPAHGANSSKDEAVHIDWNSRTNKEGEKYMNQTT